MISGTLRPQTGTKILGEGDGSIVMAVKDFGSGKNMFHVGNAKNVDFYKISISGNIAENPIGEKYNAKDGIHTLDIWHSSFITVRECHIQDNAYVAIRIIDTLNEHITVDHCKFTTVDCGIEILGSTDVTDLKVTNNLFDGHPNSEPITLYGSGHYKDILIRGNTIKNKFYGNAILCGVSEYNPLIENLKILNNTIYDCATGIVVYNAHGAVIEGNIINNRNNCGAETSKSGSAIKISHCSDLTVSGNDISNIRQFGMQIKNCENTQVQKNTFTNTAYVNIDFCPVDFRGGNKNVIFEENIIDQNDPSIPCYGKYYIRVHGDGNHTTKIKNNKIGNGTIFLEADSSNFIVVGNDGKILDKGKGNMFVEPVTTKDDKPGSGSVTKDPSKDAGTGTLTGSEDGKDETAALPMTVALNGITYTIRADKTAAVTKIDKIKKATIDTVTVGGSVYPVTEIAANAAAKNKKLSKLTIGSNIKKIGKKAFFQCGKLKKITIKANKSLKTGKKAFDKIHKNAVITLKGVKGNTKKKLIKKIQKQTTAKVK